MGRGRRQKRKRKKKKKRTTKKTCQIQQASQRDFASAVVFGG
jgi:hypothetical protein